MSAGVPKALTVIVIMALSITMLTISYSHSILTENDFSDPDLEMYDEVVFSNYSVMVFSDSARFSFIVESLANSTSNITSTESFDISRAEVIVVVDQTWFDDNDKNATIQGLKVLILQGNPVLFLTDTPEVLSRVCTELAVSHSYSEDSDVSSIKIRNDGGSSSFGATMEDESTSLIHAYNWAVIRLQD